MAANDPEEVIYFNDRSHCQILKITEIINLSQKSSWEKLNWWRIYDSNRLMLQTQGTKTYASTDKSYVCAKHECTCDFILLLLGVLLLFLFFKSKSLKYVWTHIQRCTFQKYTELYFSTQANNGILYKMTKLLGPVFRELFFKRRLVCAKERGSKRLCYQEVEICWQHILLPWNDHAKTLIDLFDEAWMPPENWVESYYCFLHCLHLFPTLLLHFTV